MSLCGRVDEKFMLKVRDASAGSRGCRESFSELLSRSSDLIGLILLVEELVMRLIGLCRNEHVPIGSPTVELLLTLMSTSVFNVEHSYNTLVFCSVRATAVSMSSQFEMYDQNRTPKEDRNR